MKKLDPSHTTGGTVKSCSLQKIVLSKNAEKVKEK